MSGSSYAHLTDIFKPKPEKTCGLPTSGVFPTNEWATYFRIDNDQFLLWIKKYKIPYFRPGKSFLVRAEDLWPRLPYITHDIPDEESDE